MLKNSLAKFLYTLFTYHSETTQHDCTSLAAAPTTLNVHVLSTEF
jgi:hypothetical protein